jgi:hypothetical protein
VTDPKAIPVVLYRKAIEGEFRNRGIAVPPTTVLDSMAKATRQAVIDHSHGWPVTSSGTVMGAATAAVNKYIAQGAGLGALESMAAGAAASEIKAKGAPRARKIATERSSSRRARAPSVPMSLSDFGDGVVQLYPIIVAEYLTQRRKAPSETKALEIAIAVRQELVKKVREA